MNELNVRSMQIQGDKKPYFSPRMISYGAIRDLTQTGSKNGNETDNNQACTDLNKKTCASDWGVKQNIVRVGEHPLGFGLYLFDYKQEYREVWGHGRQFGVMAQEVETVMPEAVSIHADGYKTVDYGMLGIRRTVH